jgi:3-deoxy-D-manno-octulosonate 8-phosphate phosphatase (KDO 8-P phosphatase)
VIKVLALDIDGVLTDGKVTFDEDGRELKTVSYEDIDAIFAARRAGLKLVLITGEATKWVDVISRRLEIEKVYREAKDKSMVLSDVCADLSVNMSEICYVGDAERDITPLTQAGLGLVPLNARAAVHAVANRVLSRKGGDGAVAEAVAILLASRNESDR